MEVRFIIEKQIQEVVDVSEEEFELLSTMNIEEKEDFFYEKASYFKDDIEEIYYNKVKEIK